MNRSARAVINSLYVSLFLLLLPLSTEARVYKNTTRPSSPTEAIETGLEGPDSGFRKYILNGHRIDGRLSYSDYDPQELTLLLKSDWQQKAQASFLEGDKGSRDLSIVRPLHSNGENWSMFANLNLLGTPGAAADIPTLAEKYIVFASRSSHKSKSDVWILNIPDSVNPLSLLTPASSGGNVPVYPGSLISWSLVEASKLSESELHVYTSRGTVEEHFVHYRRAYIEKGYRYDDLIENDHGVRLLLSDDISEVDISLQREQQGNKGIVSIIQVRKRR